MAVDGFVLIRVLVRLIKTLNESLSVEKGKQKECNFPRNKDRKQGQCEHPVETTQTFLRALIHLATENSFRILTFVVVNFE